MLSKPPFPKRRENPAASPALAPAPAPALAPPPASRPALMPVAQDTVQDRVYAELSDALICGRLRGGQSLQIRDLAATFQTSVMPVREALRRLLAEGSLEATASRRVRVPPITRERLEDIFAARLLVEGRAAELAAERATDDLDARLHAADLAFGRAVAANDVDAELQANRQFHFTLYEAAGSATLMAIIRSLWLQSGPYLRVAVEQHQTQPAAPRDTHHHEVMQAVAQRDPAATRVALQADLRWVLALMEV